LINKEDFFINEISASSHNGDDGAYIDGFVYSMDAFFEDVHFKKEWVDNAQMSLKQIAYKAMLINISDAIVMNAKPKYALISLAFPKSLSLDEIKELASGFNKAADDFGVEIIGGDTIENHKIDISITIISKTKKPIFRKTLKEGDLLCYSGKLGGAKRDLKRLFRGEKIKKSSRFIKPKLRGEFFYEASKYISASMDISDGLFIDLKKLSKASNLGFEFLEPISDEVGTSAEEYELLLGVSPKHVKKLKSIAKKHKLKLTFFAKAIEGSYTNSYLDNHFN